MRVGSSAFFGVRYQRAIDEPKVVFNDLEVEMD